MLASTAIEATLQSAYGETPLKIKAASHQQEQKDGRKNKRINLFFLLVWNSDNVQHTRQNGI